MKLTFNIVTFLFLVSGSTGAQQLQITVDSNQMLIGDQRVIHLRLSGSSSLQIDTLLLDSWNQGNIEPLGMTAWRESGTERLKDIYFTVFDTGYVRVAPIGLTLQDNGSYDTIYSNDLALDVYPVVVDSTGLAPLREIHKEPLTFRDFLPYLIGTLILLSILAFFLFRPKKKELEPVRIEVPIPPDEVALGRLSELDGKKLWQAGQIKHYQSELTHIIRWYLEEKFRVPALESTTTEILKSLDSDHITMEQRSDLDHILNMADLVKFAKAKPEISVHQEFMKMAEQFVRGTRDFSFAHEEEEE